MDPDSDRSVPTARAKPEDRESEPAYLVVLDGDAAHRHTLPEQGELIIGREEGVDLRIASLSISRRHARVEVRDRTVYIADLGSQNGVVVNGAAITGEHVLRPRDMITLGTVVLLFYGEATRTAGDAGLAFAALVEEALSRRATFSLVAIRFPQPRRDEVDGPNVAAGFPASWHDDRTLLLLCRGAAAEAARAMADRVLEPLAGGRALVGVASHPRDGETRETLVLHALADLAPGGTAKREIAIPGGTITVANPEMLRVYAMLERLAARDVPIIIGGETGTGKELAACAVHQLSPRRDGPFVALNCAAVPENLAETELFGHERGAFSGALGTKVGLLEAARGGTVFLDEIAELSLGIQAKLLRVLETRKLRRLGDIKERDINLRIVAATNRDLEAEVSAGRFREDLFFRLSVASIQLPPLRSRPKEILLLGERFLHDACVRAGQASMHLSAEAVGILLAHPWRGNLRELKNTMEFVAANTIGPVIEPEHLPARLRRPPTPPPSPTAERPAAAPRTLDDEIRELERGRMAAALAASGGNQTRAAELIGMARRTFLDKMKLYDLGHSGKPRAK